MVKVHGMSASGNCHKVRMVLEALKLPYTWHEVPMRGGATRTAAFLAMNPNGQVPVAEVEPGVFMPESNAIMHYLAEGSPLLPNDRLKRARVMQWLFFEQYSHEPYIATARYIALYLGLPEARRAEYEGKQKGGHAALIVMESHLANADYFVGDRFTIADIALYAYTHVADEGGFSLDAYPAINRWLARIAAHPKHLTMDDG